MNISEQLLKMRKDFKNSCVPLERFALYNGLTDNQAMQLLTLARDIEDDIALGTSYKQFVKVFNRMSDAEKKEIELIIDEQDSCEDVKANDKLNGLLGKSNFWEAKK